MPVQKVLLAQPRGFCAGVEMAIKALAWMVRVHDEPVYCYHEIVHNQLVVDRFRKLGVVFIDDVAEVPTGAPLMLSAHGSAPEVVQFGGNVTDESFHIVRNGLKSANNPVKTIHGWGDEAYATTVYNVVDFNYFAVRKGQVSVLIQSTADYAHIRNLMKAVLARL